jgi:hypothetical protein
MPSFSHEALLELLGRRPTLALELLRDMLRLPLPAECTVQVGDSAAARAILEDLMANGTYPYQSDFAKRYVAQGRDEGRAEGKALAVLAVLAARGVKVSAALRSTRGSRGRSPRTRRPT